MIPRMTRRLMALLLLLSLAITTLSACGDRGAWASDDVIQAARHVHGGQPELTLVTILHRETHRGEHTGLFINGRERVIFDPAGSWRLPDHALRGDVVFGMTKGAGLSYYMTHVRETHYAVVQRVPVSDEVAEQALALALETGSVSAGFCAASTSGVLRQLPGFETVRRTFFPQTLMRSFAEIPGVQTHELHHNDPDVQRKAWRVQEPLSTVAAF